MHGKEEVKVFLLSNCMATGGINHRNRRRRCCFYWVLYGNNGVQGAQEEGLIY